MPKRLKPRSRSRKSSHEPVPVETVPMGEPPIELDPSYDLVPLDGEVPPPEIPPQDPMGVGEPVEGARGKKKLLKGWKTKAGLALLGALSGLLGAKGMQKLDDPGSNKDLEMDMLHMDERNRNQNILRILESARMDRSNATNRQQLAQNAPDLYSSVMAGRQIPKGSVVLGGQQREDLMQQLVMAMDKGQYQKQNPLSDLMG